MPFLIVLFFSVFSASLAQGAEWFTDKPREMKALLADPREAQLRVGYLYTGNKRSNLELGFGGHLGFFRQQTEEKVFAVDIRGLITARLGSNSHFFDYQNGDMIGGAAATYKT